MEKTRTPIRCADAVARIGDEYVVIERLTEPRGLAFPGGKLDAGETAESAVCREFGEETGLTLTIEGTIGIFDDPGRDPRGDYVSTVFHGRATGTIKEEEGKVRVCLLTSREIHFLNSQFVSDHYRMFCDYEKLKK